MRRKRAYHSAARTNQAQETRQRILTAAKELFSKRGYEGATVDLIASAAEVSAPTIFSVFKSKEGILKELITSVLFGRSYKSLVDQSSAETDPRLSLRAAARISRTIYDAETREIGFLRRASMLNPELDKILKAGDRQRYERQQNTIKRLLEARLLSPSLDNDKARDVMWTLSSWDIYRMLVMERGWTSDAYEDWLAGTLSLTLLAEQPQPTQVNQAYTPARPESENDPTTESSFRPKHP